MCAYVCAEGESVCACANEYICAKRVCVTVASYPGSRWAGKERAWYLLFAHALNFPEILGNRKLLCFIRTTVTT